MKTPTAAALTELEREIDAPGAGLDRLRLVPTPFVPEVRLHLAEDAIVWWARMEAAAGHTLPPPYWASAWAGGQALARHLLDHPELVAGRRVLDLAAGSGLVAIAAALAARPGRRQRHRPVRRGGRRTQRPGQPGRRRRQRGGPARLRPPARRTWCSPGTSSTPRRWPAGCCRSCAAQPPRRAGARRRPRPGPPAAQPAGRGGQLPGAHHRTRRRHADAPRRGAAPPLTRRRCAGAVGASAARGRSAAWVASAGRRPGREPLTSRVRATRQRRALRAQRAVLAVARVEPGLVGQPVEQLVLDVVDEPAEASGSLSVLPTPPGKRRVAGEQVRGAGRVAVEQRDRARRVPDEVDDLQRAVADRDGVAVGEGSASTGSPAASSACASAAAPVLATTSSSASQWSMCRWVVTTVASPPSPTSSSSRGASLAASISSCVAGVGAAQQVGVVVHRPDRELRDGEPVGSRTAGGRRA